MKSVHKCLGIALQNVRNCDTKQCHPANSVCAAKTCVYINMWGCGVEFLINAEEIGAVANVCQ
jgi:hypothetical protein